ncbi:hypothetical protein [Methanoculleus sp.]|uniref:hypothetical protein n=1 Tax=Methanoculleus sp. TaxID=90427 RepID=UPI002FC6BE0F
MRGRWGREYSIREYNSGVYTYRKRVSSHYHILSYERPGAEQDPRDEVPGRPGRVAAAG